MDSTGMMQQQLPIPTSHRGYSFQPLTQQPMQLPPAVSPGATIPQPYVSATAQAMDPAGPGLPYGSGASSRPAGRRSPSRGRHRSRDRSNHSSRQPSISATPPSAGRRMGPQETSDWNDLIGSLTDRLTTLENHNRATGQRTAEILGVLNVMDAKIETLLIPIAEDIPLYKKYVEARFHRFETIAEGKFQSHDETLVQHQNSMEVAGQHFQVAGDRFGLMEAAMDRLTDSLQLLQVQVASVGDSVGNAQQFNMGTPLQPPTQRPHHDLPTAGRPGFSSLYPNLRPEPMAPGNMPRHDYPQAEAQTFVQSPGMPASFAMPAPQPAAQSPWDEDNLGTPNQRPSGPYGDGDVPHAQPQDGRFNSYDRSLQYAPVHPHPSSWEPSYKENKDLVKFDATINSYVDWSQAVLDHLSRTNRGWTSLLRFIEIQPNPVRYEDLAVQHVGGVNSWDIACHLETFLCSWVCKSIKQRRSALCGNQPGNGLEMWRQLHLEYKGSGELISASGRKVLQDFPRCKSMEHLSAHLDSWKQLVDDYGSMIAVHVPDQLKTMLFAVIPEEIEAELDHPMNAHITTCEQVIGYCKAKTVKSRQKLLAAQKLRALAVTSTGRLSPLVEPLPVEETIPNWAQPLIAALNQSGGARGRDAKGRGRGDRSRSPSPSARARTPSPSGFKPKGKFIWRGGCNHCNAPDHQRKDCKVFLALKEKNGGNLPDGYKGCREIAYEKWRNNQKTKGAGKGAGSVKALAQSATMPDISSRGDDSDSDFSESDLPASGLVTALTQPVKSVPKKSKFSGSVTIHNEQELDLLLKTHPTIAALPTDPQARAELHQLAPKSKKYVYVMVDSGASINAGWAKKHFPGSVVRTSPGQLKGEFANTANGDRLYNEGEFDVTGECDGVSMSIGFTNMKVDTPIASIRKFCKSGNDVSFYEGGGCIVNRKTGAKARFMEMAGVYFLKLKLKQPTNDANGLDFVRPVP